jgi:hypothetical protein
VEDDKFSMPRVSEWMLSSGSIGTVTPCPVVRQDSSPTKACSIAGSRRTEAVELVVLSRLLTEMPQPRLVSKPMGLPEAETQPKPDGQQVVVKKILEPLTDAQVRDRREVLRQQAEFLSNTL